MINAASEFELEGMGEFESEWETELESELEAEEFMGRPVQSEFEEEYEGELEGEYEGEEFARITRAARGAAGWVRRNRRTLQRLARVAAPIVGTAVGGPLGAAIGRVAATALREGEFEYELEGEFEGELEGEFEGEFEEEAARPVTQQEALAEFMAAVAARAQTEAEAEAMAGAAATAAIAPSDRAALGTVLPHLVRGIAILTRILRRRADTRTAVRLGPQIMRVTARRLARRAAVQPVTRGTAARVMAATTRQTLANPRAAATALQRNVRATNAVARRRPPVSVGRRGRLAPVG